MEAGKKGEKKRKQGEKEKTRGKGGKAKGVKEENQEEAAENR